MRSLRSQGLLFYLDHYRHQSQRRIELIDRLGALSVAIGNRNGIEEADE